MAKAVRWQIPFVSSIEKTQYRIDIYDEQDGTWSGVTTLTGGPSPIVTDEDASDDFFAPIRTQTGNIEVCTAIPGGGTLRLEDILPENNIARPVRLVSIASDMSEKIEWQGFLSCQAYNQAYTDIPEIIQLPINSVLEAMDSVEVEMADKMMFNRIIAHLLYAMQTIKDKSGMDLFTNIVTPEYCRHALISKYFYNNVYFTADQVVSGDNIVVEVHSISCKQILSQIAQFFGCCWREVGQDIYMEVIGEGGNYTAFEFSTFANRYLNNTGVTISSPRALLTENLADCEWMGTGHQKSVLQGKRRVKVSTSLKDFECNIELQECPIGSLIENPEDRQETWGEVHANTNDTFYSLATFRSWLEKVNVALADNPNGKAVTISKYSSSPSGLKYDQTVFFKSDDFRNMYSELFEIASGNTLVGDVYHYVTAYMAYMRLLSTELDEDDNPISELTSGLMICGLPQGFKVSVQNYLPTTWFNLSKDDYIYKQSSPMLFKAHKGKFILDIEVGAVTTQDTTSQRNDYPLDRNYNTRQAIGLTMAIQWGNRWLRYTDMNGERLWVWNTSFATVKLTEKDPGCSSMSMHYEIPCPPLSGVVTIYIYPKLYGDYNLEISRNVIEMFLTKLSLNYEPEDQELLSDRSENAYTIETGKAFKDVAEISLALSSDAKNNKLATMIYDSSAKPVSLISLGSSAQVRPEIDLLHRMKDYYTDPKVILDVESQRLASPLPILNLNGINDGKVYTPLAESRDWRAEKSTLTCFEIPN